MILFASYSRLKFKVTLKGIVHCILSDLPLYAMPKRSSDQTAQNEETFPKEVGVNLTKIA